MTRSVRLAGGALVLAFFGAWFWNLAGAGASAPDEKKKPDVAKFMRAKLAVSDMVLDGIVTEDFDKIEKGATRLQLISAAEEWKVSDNQSYLDHSEQFRKIVGRMKEQARKKNLDGAALNYVEMTMSCIECHKSLRNPMPAK
jgi:hypothetical protein